MLHRAEDSYNNNSLQLKVDLHSYFNISVDAWDSVSVPKQCIRFFFSSMHHYFKAVQSPVVSGLFLNAAQDWHNSGLNQENTDTDMKSFL